MNQCSDCGSQGVKLWRERLVFTSAAKLLCLHCAKKNQGNKSINEYSEIGWFVPAIQVADTDYYYGHITVPHDLFRQWKNLPEKM